MRRRGTSPGGWHRWGTRPWGSGRAATGRPRTDRPLRGPAQTRSAPPQRHALGAETLRPSRSQPGALDRTGADWPILSPAHRRRPLPCYLPLELRSIINAPSDDKFMRVCAQEDSKQWLSVNVSKKMQKATDNSTTPCAHAEYSGERCNKWLTHNRTMTAHSKSCPSLCTGCQSKQDFFSSPYEGVPWLTKLARS